MLLSVTNVAFGEVNAKDFSAKNSPHLPPANVTQFEDGRDYFSYQNPKAHIYGVRIDMVGYARRGMPVVEVPDGWEQGRKHFANSSYHKETLHQEKELER